MRLLASDLRLALRQMGRQPSYTAIAVLSMAVAIGANGLVYGLVDNLVFNPFNFPDPGRLVSVSNAFPRINRDEGFIERHSPAEVEDIARASSLTAVGSFDLGNRAISNGSAADRVFTALILDDPLPAMARPPIHGRGFTPEELAPNGPAVAIINHRLWTSLFNADPDAIGRTVMVNSVPRTLVGVLDEGPGLIGTELWIPWGGDRTQMPRNARPFTVIARLAPGATIADVNAELETIAARAAADHLGEFAEYEGYRLRAATWTEAVTGQARGVANLLVGAGLFVLLIACANLTSLMLTRLNARRREIAVRYAMGASGWQVTRLLLVESLVIAAAASVLGLVLATVAIGPVASLLPQQLANLTDMPVIDQRVIAYGALVAFAAALVVTAVPAWQARRAAPQASLRHGLTTTAARQRLRSALVVAELALAVVLLVGAGLLLQSFAHIQRIDPGFRTDHMLTMRLTLAWEKYGLEGTKVFFNQLVDELEALPEVERTAAMSQFPPQLSFSTRFQVEGVAPGGDTLPTAAFTIVSPGVFETLQVPVVSGRPLTRADRADAPTAVVVNEAFMNRFLDGRPNARLVMASGEVVAEVVGVVANTRNDTLLRPPQPELFATIDQAPANNQLFLMIRTTTDPVAALPAVRRRLAELDPEQPPYLIQTMDEAVAGTVSPQRIALTLVTGIAIVALVIACIGVYGVVSFWVATRSREIGIRVALGASARQIGALVAGQTGRLVAIGAALGLAGGVLAGRAAQTLLFETGAADPVTLVGVVALLAVVGIVAGYLPSRRALNIDPVKVLRTE
jgi:putative ABC transport system permease protein